MRSRHVRVYRALLRVYPRRFRADYQEEMARVFAQQLHYARVTEGWTGVLRVWARSLVDLVATAPTEHLEKEVLVTSPVGSSHKPTTVRVKASDSAWTWVGMLPFGLLLALTFMAPNYMEAAWLSPPTMARLPAGFVMIGLALLWSVLGLGVMSIAPSRGWRVATLLVFAAPASAIVVMTPALVLIVLNHTT